MQRRGDAGAPCSGDMQRVGSCRVVEVGKSKVAEGKSIPCGRCHLPPCRCLAGYSTEFRALASASGSRGAQGTLQVDLYANPAAKAAQAERGAC